MHPKNLYCYNNKRPYKMVAAFYTNFMQKAPYFEIRGFLYE